MPDIDACEYESGVRSHFFRVLRAKELSRLVEDWKGNPDVVGVVKFCETQLAELASRPVLTCV